MTLFPRPCDVPKNRLETLLTLWCDFDPFFVTVQKLRSILNTNSVEYELVTVVSTNKGSSCPFSRVSMGSTQECGVVSRNHSIPADMDLSMSDLDISMSQKHGYIHVRSRNMDIHVPNIDYQNVCFTLRTGGVSILFVQLLQLSIAPLVALRDLGEQMLSHQLDFTNFHFSSRQCLVNSISRIVSQKWKILISLTTQVWDSASLTGSIPASKLPDLLNLDKTFLVWSTESANFLCFLDRLGKHTKDNGGECFDRRPAWRWVVGGSPREGGRRLRLWGRDPSLLAGRRSESLF